MKVKFLKDHGAYKSNETHDLPEASSNYLVRCSVAVPAKEKVEKTVEPEKNDQAGPGTKKEIAPEKEKVVKKPAKEKVEK